MMSSLDSFEHPDAEDQGHGSQTQGHGSQTRRPQDIELHEFARDDDRAARADREARKAAYLQAVGRLTAALGAAPDASLAELSAAFRAVALAALPQLCAGGASGRDFAAAARAFGTLCSPSGRTALYWGRPPPSEAEFARSPTDVLLPLLQPAGGDGPYRACALLAVSVAGSARDFDAAGAPTRVFVVAAQYALHASDVRRSRADFERLHERANADLGGAVPALPGAEDALERPALLEAYLRALWLGPRAVGCFWPPLLAFLGVDPGRLWAADEAALVALLDRRCSARGWYVVPARWLAAWRAFAQGGAPPPGPVNGDELSDLLGSGGLREGLRAAHDYRCVNAGVWALWAAVHGSVGPWVGVPRAECDVYASEALTVDAAAARLGRWARQRRRRPGSGSLVARASRGDRGPDVTPAALLAAAAALRLRLPLLRRRDALFDGLRDSAEAEATAAVRVQVAWRLRALPRLAAARREAAAAARAAVLQRAWWAHWRRRHVMAGTRPVRALYGCRAELLLLARSADFAGCFDPVLVSGFAGQLRTSSSSSSPSVVDGPVALLPALAPDDELRVGGSAVPARALRREFSLTGLGRDVAVRYGQVLACFALRWLRAGAQARCRLAGGGWAEWGEPSSVRVDAASLSRLQWGDGGRASSVRLRRIASVDAAAQDGRIVLMGAAGPLVELWPLEDDYAMWVAMLEWWVWSGGVGRR